MPIHDQNLRFVAWMMLTGVCLAAVGIVRGWAWKYRNKWLLLLAIPPAIVPAYVTYRVVTAFTVAAYRDRGEVVIWAWVIFTFYLWERGNSYKEDAERERKWGQEKLAELYKEREAATK